MIYLGADHAGYNLKEIIKGYLAERGYDYKDLGNKEQDNQDDYPDFGLVVAQRVVQENAQGILICGTGLGMCMVANKVKGARATLCLDEFCAEQARKHNNSNILCLAGQGTDHETAKGVVKAWLETKFSNKERHQRRLDKITQIEQK